MSVTESHCTPYAIEAWGDPALFPSSSREQNGDAKKAEMEVVVRGSQGPSKDITAGKMLSPANPRRRAVPPKLLL